MKNKMKTKKAVTKRFTMTASGKLKRKQCGKNHKAWGRTVKQRRQLAKASYVNSTDQKRISQLFQG
jgi:large subunit ribosomal protein L35